MWMLQKIILINLRCTVYSVKTPVIRSQAKLSGDSFQLMSQMKHQGLSCFAWTIFVLQIIHFI